MACFSDINVSQGSVATYARWGGSFNIFHLTTNLPRNFQWIFFKSVRITENCGHKSLAPLFGPPCTVAFSHCSACIVDRNGRVNSAEAAAAAAAVSERKQLSAAASRRPAADSGRWQAVCRAAVEWNSLLSRLKWATRLETWRVSARVTSHSWAGLGQKAPCGLGSVVE